MLLQINIVYLISPTRNSNALAKHMGNILGHICKMKTLLLEDNCLFTVSIASSGETMFAPKT